MLGPEIFVRVQTFWQRPFVPLHNFCHPDSQYTSQSWFVGSWCNLNRINTWQLSSSHISLRMKVLNDSSKNPNESICEQVLLSTLYDFLVKTNVKKKKILSYLKSCTNTWCTKSFARCISHTRRQEVLGKILIPSAADHSNWLARWQARKGSEQLQMGPM